MLAEIQSWVIPLFPITNTHFIDLFYRSWGSGDMNYLDKSVNRFDKFGAFFTLSHVHIYVYTIYVCVCGHKLLQLDVLNDICDIQIKYVVFREKNGADGTRPK